MSDLGLILSKANMSPKASDVDLDSVDGIKKFVMGLRGDKDLDKQAWDRAVKEDIARHLFATAATEHSYSAKYKGKESIYDISIQLQHIEKQDKPDWADILCSCPQFHKRQFCKHCVAALLRRVQPNGPQAPVPDGIESAPSSQAALTPPSAPAATASATRNGRRQLPSSFAQLKAKPKR